MSTGTTYLAISLCISVLLQDLHSNMVNFEGKSLLMFHQIRQWKHYSEYRDIINHKLRKEFPDGIPKTAIMYASREFWIGK